MSREATTERPWINPAGGPTELLLLSSVLARAREVAGGQWHVVRRSAYHDFFGGHPAVMSMGLPPIDAAIVQCETWTKDTSGPGEQRPYQRLARLFGLKTPVEERLFMPRSVNAGLEVLLRLLPFGRQKVIAFTPVGRSPRASLEREAAEAIVRLLVEAGLAVVQFGERDDPYVHGAYSTLGLLSPGQTVEMVRRCDAVLSVDSFLLHAGRLAERPAIVLWGPTDPEIFGYDDQVNLKGVRDHCHENESCAGQHRAGQAAGACPLKAEHCMTMMTGKKILDKAIELAL